MILFVAESAPRDVKAVPYNSSAVKLTWQEPVPKPTQEEVRVLKGVIFNNLNND